jgi:nicotinate-nucleotide pyrophosphorylase (carboxylating)
MSNADYRTLIELALKEDFSLNGDITSNAVFKDETCVAELISKEDGILAGLKIFRSVFLYLDPKIKVRFFYKDGDEIRKNGHIASISGKARSILSAERIALNFLCFLSGIATATKKAVNSSLKKGRALILDTRKTLPGYRKLSKYAVRMGGGRNHRLGLYDMILIKDNHIGAVGSISEAVRRARKKCGSKYKIEVECRTLDEVKEAIANKVDIIMLDNMNNKIIRQAVKINNACIPLEASGNMTLERIAEVSRLGVNYISVGMLTHSVKTFDLSLQIKINKKDKR